MTFVSGGSGANSNVVRRQVPAPVIFLFSRFSACSASSGVNDWPGIAAAEVLVEPESAAGGMLLSADLGPPLDTNIEAHPTMAKVVFFTFQILEKPVFHDKEPIILNDDVRRLKINPPEESLASCTSSPTR